MSSTHLLQEAVCRWAELRPAAVAFSCPPESITFAELESASNQLAHFLVRNGIKKGEPVGVFLPRSTRTAVAVYGILKSGGVLVPLDPNLSTAAVGRLIEDAGIEWVLTDPRRERVLAPLVSQLTGVVGCNNLQTRSVRWEELDGEPTGPCEVSVTTSEPAYIMYSSGSTGVPKGITHSHFSGLAYARNSIATYGVTADDVIANHSPINFDMSTFGYFAGPLAGARTVIVPEAHTRFPASLVKLIADERVTLWYSVPLALVQLLLRTTLTDYDLDSLRWVKFGGETFPVKHLRQLMLELPAARFANVYGPAEVNQCTHYTVPREFAAQSLNAGVPIGRTWQDTDFRILGDGGEVVVDEGELLIRSPTMMLGYWRKPDLTAASMWHPEDGSPPFYRTGDFVRCAEDGNLEFVGRRDRQTKIRGYRIELDEVERSILDVQDIQEAAVYPVVSDEGERSLQASVILSEGADWDEKTLMALLSSRISSYAVPSRILIATILPRTGSGKIDRRSLAEGARSSR